MINFVLNTKNISNDSNIFTFKDYVNDFDKIYALSKTNDVYIIYEDHFCSTSLYDFTIKYIPKGWEKFFGEVVKNNILQDISTELQLKCLTRTIFPPIYLTYNCFYLTQPSKIKVIIIGQDPYFNNKEAMGLCFSVYDNINFPSSLTNLLKEWHNDINLDIPKSGNLTKWAINGCLMLNTSLSVLEGRENVGKHTVLWSKFMDTLFEFINRECDKSVVILLGNYAKQYKSKFDNTKFMFVEAPHPSGLSAYRGFIGSKIFSKTNEYLQKMQREPMDWNLE